MTATSTSAAWEAANRIFPSAEYEKDFQASNRAGYPIYRSTDPSVNAWISDLGNRLEVNLPDGTHRNIWIEAPVEAIQKDAEDTNKMGRVETAKRIQRFMYWYTKEYVHELDNKKREDTAVKEMQNAATEGGEIKCVVLTAENNARVMMDCITECIRAVSILGNPEEDVEDWMLAGINAMMDKANEEHVVPFDLPNSICGLLCAQFRRPSGEKGDV